MLSNVNISSLSPQSFKMFKFPTINKSVLCLLPGFCLNYTFGSFRLYIQLPGLKLICLAMKFQIEDSLLNRF